MMTAAGVEVPFYRTPTGRRMVLCPCRIKVQVRVGEVLAVHSAYDPDFRRDPEREGDRCVYSNWRFEELDAEAFGLEFGTISPPETEEHHASS